MFGFFLLKCNAVCNINGPQIKKETAKPKNTPLNKQLLCLMIVKVVVVENYIVGQVGCHGPGGGHWFWLCGIHCVGGYGDVIGRHHCDWGHVSCGCNVLVVVVLVVTVIVIVLIVVLGLLPLVMIVYIHIYLIVMIVVIVWSWWGYRWCMMVAMMITSL